MTTDPSSKERTFLAKVICSNCGHFAMEHTGGGMSCPVETTWPTSNQCAEVEFPCGHTVAREEECPRCEIERLTKALATANANHEHFERLYYLELQKHESSDETTDEPSPLQTERDVYCLALSQLVRTLDAVHNDPRYKAVWESYMIHGGRYTEPTYTVELESARKLLSHYGLPDKPRERARLPPDEFMLDDARDILIKSNLRVAGNEEFILRLMKAYTRPVETSGWCSCPPDKCDGSKPVGECRFQRLGFTGVGVPPEKATETTGRRIDLGPSLTPQEIAETTGQEHQKATAPLCAVCDHLEELHKTFNLQHPFTLKPSKASCIHRFDFVPFKGIICTQCGVPATTETVPVGHTTHHWVKQGSGSICDQCGLIRTSRPENGLGDV